MIVGGYVANSKSSSSNLKTFKCQILKHYLSDLPVAELCIRSILIVRVSITGPVRTSTHTMTLPSPSDVVYNPCSKLI